MSLIVVNAGEAAFLADGVTGVAYTLRLATNDPTSGLTPEQVQALDETDFTEATFTGYSSVSLATGDWTIDQGNPTEAANTTKSFTSTADQTAESVLGYYVTRDSDGALVWFELFPGAVVVEFDADEIQITPRVTLDDREGHAVETGTITAYGGSSAPDGWLLCDGSAVSRTTQDSLFAVIGTTYGAGDGSTTFNLPDLRQAFPMGVADSGTGASLGDSGGAIDHVHGLDTSSSHARIFPQSNEIRAARKDTETWTESVVATNVTTAVGSNTRERGSELGGDSDSANPPYVTVHYIIKS